MNCKKFLMFVVCLAGFLFFATRANAAQVVVGVGTSAPWPTAAIAAVSIDRVTGAPAPCGTHIWTGQDGLVGAVVKGIDPRGGPIVPGSIWVAWDNNVAPTVVCTYLSATSLDGLRLFYAQVAAGNGTLNFVTGAAPGNLILGLADTDPVVPAAVAALINGAHFNVAFTALRPEDAQFVFFRTANAVAGGGFAYNPGCALNGIAPILSSFSNTNNVSVSCFRISGADPISGVPIPGSKAISIGAEPVVLFYNTNGNLGAAGGPPLPTNILSKTATKFFSGQFGSSQSIFGPNVVNTVMSEIQREPLSGAYNAFEFQVVHARDGNSSDYQEGLNLASPAPPIPPVPAACFVPPAPFVPCTNPMFINSGANSIRYRAISSSEMVKAVNGTTAVPTVNPDRLGYAFYGLQNFFLPPGVSHLKYLTLQGMDPLYPNYAANNGLWGSCLGAINNLPVSNFTCTTTLPSFDHIIDGNYRVWQTLRGVVNTAAPLPPPLAQTLIQASQDQAAFALLNPGQGGITPPAGAIINVLADFVPTFFYPGGAQTQFFKLFRSHYAISGVLANNGTNPPVAFCAADQVAPNCFEEGGDMAGVGYWIISDQAYFNITGSEVLTHIE